MFIESVYGEKLINSFDINGIRFEAVKCPAAVWCGALGYAGNCEEEPDIAGLLARYQTSCNIAKNEAAKPDWSCAISIDYWKKEGALRGMMFAQQVLTEQQDARYDVYTMPESVFIRLANTAEAAKMAFGKDHCEVYELFGVIKDILDECGYELGSGGAQEIEMYNHSAGISYAYVPVIPKGI